MEYGSIEREIQIDATPEVVYQVISTPEHLQEWWPDEAELEPVAGGTGRITFGDSSSPDAMSETLSVVEADPPRRFSFRWVADEGEPTTSSKSLLVTFDLIPTGCRHAAPLHRDGVPGEGLGGGGPRGAVPRARRRLGPLPPPSRRVRRPDGVDAMSAVIDDDLWSAVGDPTRRRMLDLLLAEAGTATTLSEQLPVTRQAVAKHLGVLDRVGLVHVTPAGRERRYEVDEAQLARAVAQLSSVGAAWDARLQRIKRIAEAIQRQKG